MDLPDFSDSKDPIISDSRDPIFNSKDPNRSLKHLKKPDFQIIVCKKRIQQN